MRGRPRAALAAALWLAAWWAAAEGAFPARLSLERKAPRGGVALDELRTRDRARHARLLLSGAPAPAPTSAQANSTGTSVVDFPVLGSNDPFTVGLYYTTVKLGNPPKEFYVQIDTGSDILWVSCSPCSGCPSSSGLKIELESFDPTGSSTASQVNCGDDICLSAFQAGEAACSTSDSSNSPCRYSFQYGDGSTTSGFYVSDTMFFDVVNDNDRTLNSSATVIFGCSSSQSGDLTNPDRAVDGIFGFGQQELSVVSQLSSQGLAPQVFSHCLSGSDRGGGTLVLGEIEEAGMVYTPLVPGQLHYNLNLTSIAVNGQTVPIDPSVFFTSNNQGTIIDSGTTLAYLAEKAYDPFVKAISASVSPSVNTIDVKGSQCYVTSSSDVFPSVTLKFEGGATMVLKPEDYLLRQGYSGNAIIWCIGWQKSQDQDVSILGDLVLKDKIVVYDLAKKRVGWTNYDCSSPVNVTAPSGKHELIDATKGNPLGSSNSLRAVYTNCLFMSIFVILVHKLVSSSCYDSSL